MSLLNVNLGILAYADGPATNQPQVRLADLKWSMLGLPTDSFRNVPISLAAGESMVIASTARATSLGSSVSISKHGDKMRISSELGQRVGRESGDSSTIWDITRSGDVCRLTAVGGAVVSFSSIQVGDLVSIESGVNPLNVGEHMILSKGADYIEFVNPLAVVESDISGVSLSIYSSGPVQKGDIVDITSPRFAFPNQGAFPVTAVTDRYIEVLNPNAFPQSVDSLDSGISIYPYAYKWMMVAADRRVSVSLNGVHSGGNEVEPSVEGDLIKNPGIFLKRGKVFEVRISNLGLQPVNGFLLLAE